MAVVDTECQLLHSHLCQLAKADKGPPLGSYCMHRQGGHWIAMVCHCCAGVRSCIMECISNSCHPVALVFTSRVNQKDHCVATVACTARAAMVATYV